MMDFLRSIDEAVAWFRQQEGKIRLISHLDSDGMAAAAILIKCFNRDSRSYSLSVVQQLNPAMLKDLEDYPLVVFSDFGSGQLEAINTYLKDKKVLILDHHKPTDTVPADNVMHVNPHLHGIDGGTEISGAGVSYLFAKALDQRNKDLAHLAVIGAIGDIQDNLTALNKTILDDALAEKKIEIMRGIRFFGRQTKPLHKILEYSSDPYIPDVTGSESGAIQFLQQLGIYPKMGSQWKRITDLDDDEVRRLTEGIIIRRADLEKPEDVLGNIYLLPQEKMGTPFKDAREFSTLLNACGRLNRASHGIGACLGDKKAKKAALADLTLYRKKILHALRWFEANRDSMVQDKSFIIINAKDKIMGTIAGTLASIISKSDVFEQGTLILSMAHLLDGNTKVSLRVAGRSGPDLRGIINDITSRVGGDSGGHMNAAGAVIPTELEQPFIETATEVFKEIS
ncbi:MAG: DHH family phosphoesterase [Nanoarchaeota archaeon]|nr:DHH family phosphoesterase [Nanoarchaeota archaeon]